ncbi:MAG: NAD(P)/FAD-dependent oxidoreductase, partial [Acidobacteriaceae bacterium]|nr:NAD(P)/FAD-dependent oxidoreductase [Acidobacteriaceae bacterium]
MSATATETARRAVIIGAGPAGLTAAYELSKHDVESVILEADSVVGGISRTAQYKGYLFDIGGHRFFTKVSLVDKMWREVLGDDMISRPRLSRIHYRSQFFQYPLEPMDALLKLGIVETIRCVYSYFVAKLFPELPERNFEAWVSNRFGRRLFSIFFKSYTEKVWGIPCKEISADWAAQRIKGLSLPSLILNALGLGNKPKDKDRVIKTLIRTFDYPRRGPGMMWSKTKDIVESRGSKVVFNAPVTKIRWEPGRVCSLEAGGKIYAGTHFVSSMPIRELLEALDPAPPPHILKAAGSFNYRDFLTVALVCKRKDLFPDNWIYVHDPLVKVGRIQNYNNWSPEMVPDPDTSCLGLEYFCFEGDGLWTSSDADLIELAKRELEHLGLAQQIDVVDGAVVRMPKAYPVYDSCYQQGLAAVREFLAMVPNLQLVGRNGMHRYNNQDHSMLTAMLAARNILG